MTDHAPVTLQAAKTAPRGSVHRIVRRFRKRKAARVWRYNPWAWDAEAGDLMVSHNGILMRLEESNGWGKRCAGELTPRTIKPPQPGLIAEIIGDDVWWLSPNEKGQRREPAVSDPCN